MAGAPQYDDGVVKFDDDGMTLRRLPLDPRRPSNDTVITVDLGRFVMPVFSPDAPHSVVAILRHHVQQQRQ